MSDLADFYVVEDLEILQEEIDRILALEYRLPSDLSSDLKRLRTSILNVLSATRTDSNAAFSRSMQLPNRIDQRWLDSSES